MRGGTRLLTLLLAGAVACADGPLSPSEERQLEIAEQRWEATGFDDYRFDMRKLCFCPPELANWATVEVRAGVVVQVTSLDPSVVISPAQFSLWPTVESLFTVVQEARQSDWIADIEVAFDPALGYPTLINLKPKTGIADAGARYETRNLEAIP